MQSNTNLIKTPEDLISHLQKCSLTVWHDPGVHQPHNAEPILMFQEISQLKTFDSWTDTVKFSKETSTPFYLITSGTNGELLVKEVNDNPLVLGFYVYCGSVDIHQQWAKKYSKLIKVCDEPEDLVFSLIGLLPKALEFYGNQIHYEKIYPNHQINPFPPLKDRAEAKKDLLAFLKLLQVDEKSFSELEKNYNQLSTKEILNYFTRANFLSRLLNFPSDLQEPWSYSSRLAFHDLEAAIQSQYAQASNKFNGLVFKGISFSDQQWETFAKSIGSDIYLPNFLITSKAKKKPLSFVQADPKTRALVTIIVPGGETEKGERGFAELKEFSLVSGQDDVIFNAQADFRILETSETSPEGKKYRNLVLLYAGNTITKTAKAKMARFEVQVSSSQPISCRICKLKLKISSEYPLYASLSAGPENQFICHKCLQPSSTSSRYPVLYIPPTTQPEQVRTFVIEGMLVLSQVEQLDIPFYGYKCSGCQQNIKGYCYRCATCDNEKKLWCNSAECNTQKKRCIDQGHSIILERSPYRFWTEKLTDEELEELNRIRVQKSLGIFKKAQDEHQKKRIMAAEELYREFLKENLNTDKLLNAKAYKKLASIAKEKSKAQEAIENHLLAIEINEKYNGCLHRSVRRSYKELTEAYIQLQDYQNAHKYSEKSLKLVQAGVKKKGEDISGIYYNHGLVCMKLGEHKKALESHQKALEIRNNAAEANWSEVVASYEALAEVYAALGDSEKAIENYQAGLEIKKNVDKGDGEWISRALEMVGDLYMKLGKIEEAIASQKEAMNVRGRMNTNDHEYFAKVYAKLANYTLKTKNYKNAEYFITSAIKRKELLPNQAPAAFLWLYKNLGLVYKELEQHQKAYHYYQKTLEIKQGYLVEDYGEIVDLYHEIGSQLTLLGRFEEAIGYHRRAESLRSDKKLDEKLGPIKTFIHLGDAYMAMKDQNQEAIVNYLDAERRIMLFCSGECKGELIDLYEKLGSLYEIEKHFDNAIKYYNEAVKLNQEVYGAKNERVKALWKKLGLIYIGLGKGAQS